MFDKKYAQFYDSFHLDKPYKEEIEFIYSWADKPRRIFDIGCGTARYWKHYPDGTILTGIDKSKDMAKANPNIVIGDITKYKKKIAKADCVTALFNVINYIPKHDWWRNLPIKKGGYFIFDIWDKQKVDEDGFNETVKTGFEGYLNIQRVITPVKYDGKAVELKVVCLDTFCEEVVLEEIHKMYVHSYSDIRKFCGRQFEIVGIKTTKKWNTWYKLRKK